MVVCQQLHKRLVFSLKWFHAWISTSRILCQEGLLCVTECLHGWRVFPCFGCNTIWIDLYFYVFGAGDRVGGTVPRTVAKLRCWRQTCFCLCWKWGHGSTHGCLCWPHASNHASKLPIYAWLKLILYGHEAWMSSVSLLLTFLSVEGIVLWLIAPIAIKSSHWLDNF